MGKRLTEYTPEERAEMVQRAKATRERKAAERASSPLRRNFKGEGYWLELARKYKVELAPWGEAPTAQRCEVYLNRYGVTQKEYLGWFGEGTMASFQELNPDWSLRAWCGIVLEAIDSGLIVSRTLAA